VTYASQYLPGQSYPASRDRLDHPLYGASIGEAFVRFWKKYAAFSGRASRSEYWWVVLISLTVSVVIFLMGVLLAGGDVAAANASLTGPEDILSYVWTLVTLVPSLAVAVRRLHDTNRSGWWTLLLVPVVGVIVLLVWYASGPNPAGARFDRPTAQLT